jgi:DNA-binding GntR family transcriptional regulator
VKVGGMPEIDHLADRPAYRQLADILRAQISDGTYPPGAQMPSAKDLGAAYGLGLDAVRRAIGVLRSEGLVSTVPRTGTVVNEPASHQVITMAAPAKISARMPSEPERRSLGLPEGIPLLIADGKNYRADRFIISVMLSE